MLVESFEGYILTLYSDINCLAPSPSLPSELHKYPFRVPEEITLIVEVVFFDSLLKTSFSN